MRSNYKRLGAFIREVSDKNTNLESDYLLGVNIGKTMMPSKANTVGTDFSKYKLVRQKQFVYGPVTSRNGDRIAISMFEEEVCMVSTSYTVFEVIDPSELLPEYLMMWFRRPEFDRYARYMSHGSVREIFGWDEMCDVDLPVPSIEKQSEVVREYHTIVDRIKLNEQLNQKLEETAQAVYKHWFVDFEFPISKEYAEEIGKPELEGEPYKSSGGKMVWNNELGQEIPAGWVIKRLNEICSKIGSGATPKGGKTSYRESGISLIRSLNVYDYNFQFKNLAFISNAQAANLSNVEIQEDDILLNITGVSVARCCKVPKNILPARVNQHVSIVRLKKKCKSTLYLLCSLCSEYYKAQLLGDSHAGSTRQAITKTDIESFRVLWPDTYSRTKFEFMAGKLLAFKEALSSQTKELVELQQLILMRLSSGVMQESMVCTRSRRSSVSMTNRVSNYEG
jgi:type I restriction enzyme S subunit